MKKSGKEMKLKEYIKKTLKATHDCDDSLYMTINFDIRLDTDMTVNDKSKNRISFMVIKQ